MKIKGLALSLAVVIGASVCFSSCQKIEEYINEKKEQAQELTDKAKSGALDVIDEGKEKVEKGADALK
ncbi:MAG TPA: hypothetical protein PK926_01950 [Spirochaetota bacterium]|nr:hypothetical protein [Spirochaetota bacterium]HPI90216.1 hypothetical protein [Spirochaetota bacterium]HPR46536.1 hypothetical protein [Spirochaetota bacterium]